MVTNGTTNPKFSYAPPRKINVQKFSESRAPELQSLQSIVKNRLNNDYKSQRNKRRRTTSFNDQIARKGHRKKKQKLGLFDKVNVESENEGVLKLPPRRVRRRCEFKSNPEKGFCCSGDGTKRLRTHVWHAKRFSMTKLWGYHLPLGLQGRGKGSRALLKRLKQGVLVHDSSYYTAVQLEGPEDSLVSILKMVLVPSTIETTHPRNHSDSILSGTTYGTAMLHQVGAPVSQPIAPVTYMWRPTFQQNNTNLDVRDNCSFRQHDVSDEKVNADVDLFEKSDSMECSSSFRHLWVWIHASAFDEGYDNLKLACQKEMEKIGISINCYSLEGQLAKLELMGSGTFQLLQKILHPVRSISENHWQLKSHLSVEENHVSQNTKSSIMKNREHYPSFAMLSLNVNDPRDSPLKRTIVPTEPISTDTLSDAQEQETNCKEPADLGGMLEKNKESSSFLSWSEFGKNQSDVDDLWYASTRGLKPPVEDSVLSMEKHREHRVKFCLDDIDFGDKNSSNKEQCSRSCPIILLKNDMKELTMGWSVILPLSWVKAFWITVVSNGAHAIGLREKQWIASDMGIPFFPQDFPDCKAYSCFLAAKAAECNEKEKLRPPSVRSLRVPILPPWGLVHTTLNKEISTMKTLDLSAREDLTNANSLSNSSPGNFKSSNFDSENSVDVVVARTSGMLTTLLDETKTGRLLLFPYAADGKARISKFMEGELMLDQRHRSSVVHDNKLCLIRVHLHPFKEGFFEEGAVICAPRFSDIFFWNSSSVKSEKGLKLSESAMRSYFKENSSGKWVMPIPEDPIDRESHRWPIGFVTTACVQGSKRLVAEGFCEAVLLSHLREEQWMKMPGKQRRSEIFVLVRNLRSVAYRLALASIVLEYQENDIEFM